MRRFRTTAAVLGVAGLALVGAACGGGTSESYHFGYTNGTSGALVGAPSADHWCNSLPARTSVDRGDFIQGCLAGFKAGQPK